MTTPINVVGEGLVGVDHRVNSSLEHGRIVAVEGDGEARRYRVEIESRRQRTPGVDAPTYQVIALGYALVPVEVLRHDGTPLIGTFSYTEGSTTYRAVTATGSVRALAVDDNVLLLGNGGTYFIVAAQPVQVRATSG